MGSTGLLGMSGETSQVERKGVKIRGDGSTAESHAESSGMRDSSFGQWAWSVSSIGKVWESVSRPHWSEEHDGDTEGEVARRRLVSWSVSGDSEGLAWWTGIAVNSW